MFDSKAEDTMPAPPAVAGVDSIRYAVCLPAYAADA